MQEQTPPSASQHILIVDDHREIRDALSTYLGRHGYRVSMADGGKAMREVLATSAVDLIVLDIMMPGDDGLTLCREVRAQGEVPVILLTAVADETDRVIGLEMGADDYVTKPFNPRELLARIKVVLRRTNSLPPQRAQPPAKQIRFDRWLLDVARRELVAADGVCTPLSTGEFRLLVVLLEHANVVLNRDQLLDLTQGRAAKVFDRSVDNQISRLRKKLEQDPKRPALISTVRGGGYMFTATPEEVTQ